MKQLSKRFGKSESNVLNDFNLQVEAQEFIVIVGPSGCGKSTLLRMIAGLEEITAGELLMDGKCVNTQASNERDIAMVFQNYALYPHLSVYDNIAFGLKIRKIKKSIIEKKVNEVASVLGLTSYLQRKPKDLSGGQRQRVALGRAIVRDAGIFLMDEPLSNLDAKLRVHMRTEIMALHRSLQATTIYVTHDQTEAMTMADRIVVLNEGYIQQIGTPKEIYSKPNNTFVASFMGSPPINLLAGILEDNKLKLMDGLVVCPTMDDTAIKRSVVIGIRPEAIRITEKSELKMRVQFTEILGADIHLHGLVGKEKVVVRIPADHSLDLKDELYLEIDKENIHLFDAETKQRYLEEGEF